MLKPSYLEQVPDRLIELYAEVEADIIADMCARLSKMDFIPSAEWQYKKLTEMGYVHDYILERLSAVSGITKKELEQLMTNSGVQALKADSVIYNKAGLNAPVLNASPALQQVLRAGYENTKGLFENLTRTTANTATKQFENMLDKAWLQINSGAFDYNTAIKSAIKDLTSKGLAVIRYPTGHTDYLETAVRRAVVTGVNQTALKLQDALADELGSDLVETTAHSGARPSHAEWQGKVFSRSGTHPKYPDFKKVTGYGTGEGLGGWNCRHSFFPYFEGMGRVYTQSELDEMNTKKYEYNGEKLTEYEATQKQRAIERNIRRWKREKIGMEAAGQPTDEAAAKLRSWREKQKDLIEQTGLKRQYERENIYFGKNKTFMDGDSKDGLTKVGKNNIIKKTESSEAAKEILKICEYNKVEYREVQRLQKELSTDEIIEKLAGGDMTEGSCSSLAFAYIGNRNGFDVLDFRGGNSTSVFARNSNIQKMMELPNVKGSVTMVKKEISGTMEVLKNIELNKEYYLATGKHAAIVRRLESGVEYLELQSKNQNGWMPFDRYGSIASTLNKRFGCRKTIDKFYGKVWEKPVVLMDVDSFKDNPDFEQILGYINTAVGSQKKGAMGSVK